MEYTINDTILSLTNVELGYGEGSDYHAVLKNVNITEKDVMRGNLVTGQVIPEFDNIDGGNAKIVQEGDVGFVDQKYTLFRHKTIEQILKYALRKSKKTDAEKVDTINQYLIEWGLEKQRSKYPCELSGGQRQRTAVIEQILSSGHFMVLDEPFSGLDVGNIRDVKKSFELIQNDHELNTIIFSTHELRLAVELADSIYVVGYADESQTHSTIVKHFDLKLMGLAWEPFSQGHLNLIDEIDKAMMNS